MNNKKIFLVNLSQGKIGEENCALLGGMLITRMQATAMERVNIPFEERNDFFLFVDEFQNFATESFAKILSEARKYKLDLTMTNQYIDQIPLPVRQAIFGNVGTMGSFVVGQGDASILATEFAPEFDAEDLKSLGAHAMYMKLCIDGMTSKPFSARSLDFRYHKFGLKQDIVNNSRGNYSMQREVIEDKIKRWSEQKYSEKGNRSVDAEKVRERKENMPAQPNDNVNRPRLTPEGGSSSQQNTNIPNISDGDTQSSATNSGSNIKPQGNNNSFTHNQPAIQKPQPAQMIKNNVPTVPVVLQQNPSRDMSGK